MINEKHGQGTHSTKMGAYKSAENTPNAQNLSVQFICPSPKVWDFNEKRLFWAFVVRGSPQDLHMHTMTLTNPNSLAIAN